MTLNQVLHSLGFDVEPSYTLYAKRIIPSGLLTPIGIWKASEAWAILRYWELIDDNGQPINMEDTNQK